MGQDVCCHIDLRGEFVPRRCVNEGEGGEGGKGSEVGGGGVSYEDI